MKWRKVELREETLSELREKESGGPQADRRGSALKGLFIYESYDRTSPTCWKGC